MARASNPLPARWAIGMLAALAAAPSPATASPPLFAAAHHSFEVGHDPRDVSVGDLNGDGRLDAVTANRAIDNAYLAKCLTVLLGTQDEDFTTTHLGLPEHCLQAEIADVNGDLRPDIVALMPSAVGLIEGLGDGRFAAPRLVQLGSTMTMTVGDLNHDGLPDIVLASSVFLNTGDWTFGPGIPFASNFYTNSASIADLDLDGHPDLVASSGTGTAVFAGNGTGTMTWRQGLPITSAFFIAVGDLNGDGWPDLGFTSGQSVKVAWGSVAGFSAFEDFPLGEYPHGLAIADLDGDACDDLIVGIDVRVRVLRGSPTAILDLHGEFPATVINRDMAVGDANGDGSVDLLITEGDDYPRQGNLHVFYGDGTGSLGRAQVSPFVLPGTPVAYFRVSLAVADVDADGHVDVGVVDQLTDSLYLLLGNGDGTFVRLAAVTTARQPTDVQSADLNSDGFGDFVTTGYSNTVAVHLGGPAGVAPANQTFATPELRELALTDVNADGWLDCVGFAQSPFVMVWPGGGDGTFAAGIQTTLPQWAGNAVVARIDADPFPDLVYASSQTGLWRRKGAGDGTFLPAIQLSGLLTYGDVAFLDVVGSAHGDLVIGTGDQFGQFATFAGNGDGTFAAPTAHSSIDIPKGFAAADFNVDGRPDLAMMSQWLYVEVHQWVSGDSLGGRRGYGGGCPLTDFAVADFDEDGRPDLIVNTEVSESSVAVLLNIGASWAGAPDSRPERGSGLAIMPNPAASNATIRFSVPRQERVRLEVFDVAGHRVHTIADRSFDAGTHALAWDGRNGNGERVSPGLYFVRLSTPATVQTGRVALIAP